MIGATDFISSAAVTGHVRHANSENKWLIKGIDLADNYLVVTFTSTNAAHLSSEAVDQSAIV